MGDILMKRSSSLQFRQFLSSYQWIKRRMVMVIPLTLLFSWVGIVEAHPSLFKAGLVSNKRSDVFDGQLQRIEASLEEGINIVWPVDGLRVDGAERTQDSHAKRGEGGNIIVSLVPAFVSLLSQNVSEVEKNQGAAAREKPESAAIKLEAEDVHLSIWLIWLTALWAAIFGPFLAATKDK